MFNRRSDKQKAVDAVGDRFQTASVLSFNHDGLEIAKVKARPTRYLPVWHVLFFIYFILLVRLVVMADMGPGAYQNRMNALAEGVWYERAAAKVMQMDPVSREIAMNLRGAMKSWEAYRTGE